jgi:hypothetical protein
MVRDISHITNFQSCRPKTDYYRLCVKAYAPLHTRFLSSVALSILGDRKEKADIPAADLFKSCLKVTVKVPVEPEVPATNVKFRPIGFPLASVSVYVIVPTVDASW